MIHEEIETRGGIELILKSIDLALMAEHLTTHKGVISKLQSYYCFVHNPVLKQLVQEQFLIMRNHVKVMLLLMDPALNEKVTVSALHQIQPVEIPCQSFVNPMGDQAIALEARTTAKAMAHDNFSSALMMKAPNVREIHVQMALQQVSLQERYSDLLQSMGRDQAPSASLEEQRKTIEMFKQFFHI